MTPIKNITISGFRGILQPLTLEFEKGNSIRSMVIYGRNGTGKSSLTDAIEWLHTESINHLRREGAGASAFRHRDADSGDTYVEVELNNQDLDTIRLSFNQERKTKPLAEGDVEAFRELAPHPFYIRFGDLKEFVYQTKSEKYDKLANLMGFEPQVRFQKSLRRIQSKLEQKLADRKRSAEQQRKELLNLLQISTAEESVFLEELEGPLKRNDVDVPDTASDLGGSIEELKNRVENDPQAKKIGELEQVKKTLESAANVPSHEKNIRACLEQAQSFVDKEAGAVDSLLVRLYESGEEVLEASDLTDSQVQYCPLCNEPYEGDLLEHVRKELEELQYLREAYAELKEARENAQDAVHQIRHQVQPLQIEDNTTFEESDLSLTALRDHAIQIYALAGKVETVMGDTAEKITNEYVLKLRQHIEVLYRQTEQFENERECLITDVIRQKKAIEEKSARAELVEDYNTLRDAREAWQKLQKMQAKHDNLQSVHGKFEAIVERYVQSNIEDVEQRFAEISEDVRTYFEVLEADTPGLSKPAMRLLPDKNRAVMLEVHFHGKSTSPAYKYLSESQLNSFGFAVFLASAKRFNPGFKFLVLDDVVNSFDGYKRPKVIDLIKDELPEYQLLLLTHDSVWRRQLGDHFPSWKRQRFVRWEPHLGPVVEGGATDLEYIEDLLNQDRPETAGGEMGRYLERQLQLLCESFKATVTYNRRNEYTLDPLFTRFRVRVKKKLGSNHVLYDLICELKKSSSFRNFCAHWKNAEVPITTVEMRDVVRKWKQVDNMVRCDECNRFPVYDGNGFECGCGDHRLEK